MHRGSHHLNLWVQGNFDSGVPGGLILLSLVFLPLLPLRPMKKRQRKQLRDSLRLLRRNLVISEQKAASKAVYDSVTKQDFFTSANHLAFYLSFDGELNPKPILEKAVEENKSCYLPVISSNNQSEMSFRLYEEDMSLNENKWGIQEPSKLRSSISPLNLEVVFVPLVGFDEKCFRLGMGKGFYDKAFNFKSRNIAARPLLVGLAHECQRVQEVPTESWDVRLDLVVTAERIYRSRIV